MFDFFTKENMNDGKTVLEFLGKAADKGSRILRDQSMRLRGEEAKQFDTAATSFAIFLRKALDEYESNENDPDR